MQIITLAAIAASIFIILVVIRKKKDQALIATGKMIKRDDSFTEHTEIFTLEGASFTNVCAALQTLDLEGSRAAYQERDGSIDFRAQGLYLAKLTQTENRGNVYRYQFRFTSWNTRYGVPLNVNTMNILLTGIEKMFLKIDPNTQVETVKEKLKTKTRFF